MISDASGRPVRSTAPRGFGNLPACLERHARSENATPETLMPTAALESHTELRPHLACLCGSSMFRRSGQAPRIRTAAEYTLNSWASLVGLARSCCASRRWAKQVLGRLSDGDELSHGAKSMAADWCNSFTIRLVW